MKPTSARTSDDEPLLFLARYVASAKEKSQFAPVTIVVGSHMAASSLRLGLVGLLGELCNVQFLTPISFALKLVAASQSSLNLRPVAGFELESILRMSLSAVLQEAPAGLDGLYPLKPDRELLGVLRRSIFELGSVGPRLLGPSGADARSTLAVSVYLKVRDQLDRRGRCLEIDRFIQGADALETPQGAALARSLGPVALFAPHNLAPVAGRMFSVFARVGELEIIELNSGFASLDERFAQTLNLGPIQSEDGATTSRVDIASSWPTTLIVHTPDRRNEIEVAIAEVLKGAQEGLAFDEMALLVSNGETYLEELYNAARRARIPVNSQSMPLAPVSRSLELFRQLVRFCRSKSRKDFVELAALCDLRNSRLGIDSAAAEEATVVADLNGDMFSWANELIETGKAEVRMELATSKSSSEVFEATWELALYLASLKGTAATFEAALAGPSWNEVAFAGWSLLGHIVSGIPLLFEASPAPGQYDRSGIGGGDLVEALRTLAQLDSMGEPVGELAFWVAFESAIAALQEPPVQDKRGVRIATVESFLPASSAKLICLGMTDDLFPPRARDGFLPESTRRSLGLLVAADRIAIAERAFFAQVRYSKTVVITLARSTVGESDSLFASPSVVELERLARASGSEVAHKVVASRGDFAKNEVNPNDLEMLNRGNLFGGSSAPVFEEDVDGVLRSSELMSIGDVIPRLFAPRVALNRDSGSTPTMISPTALERWLHCPYEFFGQQILGVRDLREPEAKFGLDPMERGSLLHELLERVERAKLASEAISSSAEISDFADIFSAAVAPFIRRARTSSRLRRFWLDRELARIRREMSEYLRRDSLYVDSTAARVGGLELKLQTDVAIDSPFGDRIELVLKGKLDRLDITDDGLTIIDYKTGGHGSYKVGGRVPAHKVQLAVYARMLDGEAMARLGLAGSVVKGMYWFVSEKDGFSEQDVSLDELNDLRVVADLAAALIHRGLFAAGLHGIGGSVRCGYCDPYQGEDLSRLRSIEEFLGEELDSSSKGVPVDVDFWRRFLDRVEGRREFA